jgi:hypothetical protein
VRIDTYAAGATPAAALHRSEFAPFATSVTLVAAARSMYSTWRATADPDERTALTAAGTLAAHAAIDSLLHEWAQRERPDLARWRSGTTLMRAARFTAALGRSLPPYLGELCQARRALGRDATADERLQAQEWMRGDGMERAYLTLLDIEDAVTVAR